MPPNGSLDSSGINAPVEVLVLEGPPSLTGLVIVARCTLSTFFMLASTTGATTYKQSLNLKYRAKQ